MTRFARCLSALLFAFVAVARLRGQDPSPKEFAALLADGQKFYSTSAWDDANAKFNAMIDLARERHDELWEARGMSGLGAVAHARSRYDEARRLLSQSLETFDRLHRSRTWRGLKGCSETAPTYSAIGTQRERGTRKRRPPPNGPGMKRAGSGRRAR